ncbi:hypothetical protein BgiMline_011690 [Biomphalaria glabrata]|nr:hypothetical protein BgiMline_029164 [Biomphalaria glabrata]
MSSANKLITDGVVESNARIDPLLFDLVIFLVGCFFTVLVCLFGIAANYLNISLFRKLGYQDGVNVSLTALAISDMCGLILELVYSVVLNSYILEKDLVVSKVVIGYITGYTFEYFTRVSSVITAYAAVERCLCVTWPLKVKSLITNKVSVVVNGGIFILYSMYLFPQFLITYFDWTYVPERNKTIYFIYFNSWRAEVFPVTYYVTDMLLPYSTYIVLITCCTTLFLKLKSKAKWRQLVSSSCDKVSHVNRKELKSARMFMTVSFMCVVLLLPHSLIFSATIFIRALALSGTNSDLSRVISTFTIFLKISYSSFTIFIYYNMSTKYRLEFQKMLSKFKTSIQLKRDDHK